MFGLQGAGGAAQGEAAARAARHQRRGDVPDMAGGDAEPGHVSRVACHLWQPTQQSTSLLWLGPISSGSSVKMTSPGAMSRVATTYLPNLWRIHCIEKKRKERKEKRKQSNGDMF